jgi:hypothetical protein
MTSTSTDACIGNAGGIDKASANKTKTFGKSTVGSTKGKKGNNETDCEDRIMLVSVTNVDEANVTAATCLLQLDSVSFEDPATTDGSGASVLTLALASIVCLFGLLF